MASHSRFFLIFFYSLLSRNAMATTSLVARLRWPWCAVRRTSASCTLQTSETHVSCCGMTKPSAFLLSLSVPHALRSLPFLFWSRDVSLMFIAHTYIALTLSQSLSLPLTPAAAVKPCVSRAITRPATKMRRSASNNREASCCKEKWEVQHTTCDRADRFSTGSVVFA